MTVSVPVGRRGLDPAGRAESPSRSRRAEWRRTLIPHSGRDELRSLPWPTVPVERREAVWRSGRAVNVFNWTEQALGAES